jgi:chromosome segregation ATPase
MELSDALIGVVFGFLGSLITGLPAWLRARAESRTAARKTDLDELRAIIDETRKERENSRESYQRLSIELEQEREKRRKLDDRVEKFENLCEDKDREIAGLRQLVEQQGCEIDKLRDELAVRDQLVTDLTVEVEELRALFEQNGLTPPPRKRSRK